MYQQLENQIQQAVDAACEASPTVDRQRLLQTFGVLTAEMCPTIVGSMENGREIASFGPISPSGHSFVAAIDANQTAGGTYRHMTVAAPVGLINKETQRDTEENAAAMLSTCCSLRTASMEPAQIVREAHHKLCRILLDSDGTDDEAVTSGLARMALDMAAYGLAQADPGSVAGWNRAAAIGFVVAPVAVFIDELAVVGSLPLGMCLPDDLADLLLAA